MTLVLFRFSQKQISWQRFTCKSVYLRCNGRKIGKGRKALRWNYQGRVPRGWLEWNPARELVGPAVKPRPQKRLFWSKRCWGENEPTPGIHAGPLPGASLLPLHFRLPGFLTVRESDTSNWESLAQRNTGTRSWNLSCFALK